MFNCMIASNTAGMTTMTIRPKQFDAFLECGILAHGFLRLRCDDCGHDAGQGDCRQAWRSVRGEDCRRQ